MARRESFSHRLFLYYFSIFVLFTVAMMAYQYNRERKIRIASLDNRLNDMSGLVDKYIRANSLTDSTGYELIDSVYHLIPVSDLRITIISIDGKVLYDSSVEGYDHMENHLHRPEVSKSHYSAYGTSVRQSASTGKEYYYFSRYFDTYYVRLAVEYNIHIQGFLKREKIFLLFMSVSFLVIWVLLSLVTRRLGESITMLRNFAARVRRGEGNDPSIIFPNNEIGETGKEIVKIYNNLARNTAELTLQKEKLFRHLHVLNEGVAFFSPERKVTFSNNHFMVFLNEISGELSLAPERLMEMEQFSKVTEFLNNHPHIERIAGETPAIEFHVENSGKFFSVRCILFHDNSFEIVLTDITRTEQTKAMRQQMTSEIAHELKTPIASVSGYLETLLVNKDLDEEEKHYFMEKALAQSIRLTDLINDIVTLNKLDEAGSSFAFEEVEVAAVVREVRDNLLSAINRKGIKVEIETDPSVIVTANKSLVVSVFQNLMENAISYAGDKITIFIKTLPADPGYHYFSFADNGIGIPGEHQPRIFERFYRVDDGRSRKTGGTGLGLAIVKNAILLHKGEISVRTRPGGGTEFLFSLPK
ncbi:MAG TPA: ATP-binding protein, partial [Bacteroidales bacterium]|nr:ATP-binding protein [Bacteroidales bacterium]